MPLRKVFQSLRDVGQAFDGMVRNRVSEPCDLGVQLSGDRLRIEPLKCRHQRVRKAVQAVAMRHDGFALHIIEHLPHLLGRKLVVIKKRNEADDSPLKVDSVLPERIVGIDQQSLGFKVVLSSNGQTRILLRKLYTNQSTCASGPIIPALCPISSSRTTASRPSGP